MKIYRSNVLLSFTMRIDGKRKFFHFAPHSRGGSYYCSNSVSEQRAIESHPFFTSGAIFVAEDDGEHGAASVEAVSKPEKLTTVKVKNCPAARDWIADNLSLTIPRVVSKGKLQQIARENGIEFEFEQQ